MMIWINIRKFCSANFTFKRKFKTELPFIVYFLLIKPGFNALLLFINFSYSKEINFYFMISKNVITVRNIPKKNVIDFLELWIILLVLIDTSLTI